MSGVNKVIILGRLGEDPESKTLSSSKVVTNFNVATSQRWKDKEGEWQEKTEWHKIVCYGKMAEMCAERLHKGQMVYLEGGLQTRSWDDKEGNKRYVTEIIVNKIDFLGAKKQEEEEFSF